MTASFSLSSRFSAPPPPSLFPFLPPTPLPLLWALATALHVFPQSDSFMVATSQKFPRGWPTSLLPFLSRSYLAGLAVSWLFQILSVRFLMEPLSPEPCEPSDLCEQDRFYQKPLCSSLPGIPRQAEPWPILLSPPGQLRCRGSGS